MEKTDNTLKILVTVLSILFLLVAIKTSYPAEDLGEMTINIAGKFIICELILFSAIYIGGTMLSVAIPAIWDYKRKHPLEDTGNEEVKQSSSEMTAPVKPRKITVLSEEIINYVTKTFENIITPDYIEKLLNNFRNLNNGGPYEVIEKIAFPDGITQFDLWNFTWNVLARIYNKEISREKMRDAGATLAIASFPLTITSDYSTVRSKLRYFENPANYSLKIIEVNCELTPHRFPIKIEEPEEIIIEAELSALEN